MSAKRFAWMAMIALVLVGCQGHSGQYDRGATRIDDVDMIPKQGHAAEVDAMVDNMPQTAPAVTRAETNIKEETFTDDDPDDAVEDEIEYTISHGIPIEINDKVKKWITYFTVKDRERFQRFLNRGEKYRKMIQAVLTDQGVPHDLYYLAMIESGFVVKARSHASAVGVWQFIRATGRRYGLKIDYYVDERQDPMRATIAAALYLKDLHLVFNSWYLAMAAYNAGESRIMGTIMKQSSRDFWELVRKNGLPSETMNYVPKFLAAVTIGRNPEKYGFTEPSNSPLPHLKPVAVPSPVKLSSLSKVAGVPKSILEEYNPHLRRGMTPSVKSYKIWVPAEYAANFEGKATEIAKHRVRAAANIASSGVTKYHRVRRGENLALIARKYGTSVRTLKKLNGMRSDRIFAGARIKVTGSTYQNYRVRRGDSLGRIARKFKTTVSSLKRLNKLRRTTIYAGQILKVGTARM